jgi:predicted AlkP superfamily pyrophosphatase or phosphodiesterase
MKHLVLIFALSLLNASCATVPAEPQPPRLIVAIAVDQFSTDLFGEYRQTYVAGLKRLSNAIVFPAGYQAHATTETCPGHATILTGTRPARSGIIANEWFDQSVTRGDDDHKIYCVEDETQPGTTSSKYVISTRHLNVLTLGDRMKRLDSRSRVVAVAGKDRSAVMMGGHMADAMWYPNRDFTSYVSLPGLPDATPAIVTEVNQRITQIIANPPRVAVPPRCAPRANSLVLQPDSDLAKALKPEKPNPVRTYRDSPEYDRATADIAIGLLKTMRLGHGPANDLLTISLAGTDNVGHAYGTQGIEMCVQQAALDQTIGSILAALDANGAPYMVVLTADHGGFDLPERLQQRGVTDAARVTREAVAASISTTLVAQFHLDIEPGKLWMAASPQGDWYLSDKVSGTLRAQILAATRAKLLSLPQVAAVATADELSRMPLPQPPVDNWSLLERARASFYAPRSGDLLVMMQPRIVPIPRPTTGLATGHGTPWDYDRRVPMLFWYPGAVAHEVPLSVETIDILPTLAPFIGLTVPAAEIDGRCIDLDPGPVDTCKQ